MSQRLMRAAAAATVCLTAAASAPAAVDDFIPGVMTIGDFSRPYRLYIPENYDPDKSYPIILFLHGAGGRGDDNIKNANEASVLLPHVRMPEYEAFILAPQLATTDNTWWLSGPMQAAMNTIDDLAGQYNIDLNRQYMTGVSLGGHGTWQGMDEANFGTRFAAGVVVCGWYQPAKAPNFVTKPMWAFHGALDTTISVQQARNMINAIILQGGQPLYTEYPDAGHGISGRVYATDAMWEWFFTQDLRYPIGPRLEYDAVELGGGLIAYTFRIENTDALELDYVLSLGFTGADGATIRQVAYNGAMPIHTETMAQIADGGGDPPYSQAGDTWVFSPFGDNAIPGTNPLTGEATTGFYEGANAFALSCYSGPGSALGGGVNVAQVVANGNVEWTGTITRNGRDHATAGVTDAVAAPLPGDFNDDGTVGGADYVIWADTFGNDGSPGKEDLRADANGDGQISGTDYVVWAEHFGQTQQ